MKVLLIDNYDPFTYNLYQYVGEILENLEKPFTFHVIRNDEKTIEEIKNENYDRIIISPGPGDSKDKEYFGVCADVLLDLGKTTPVLGVCLGMQGIAHYYGGKGVFLGLPQDIEVMRYHSLVVEYNSLPSCLTITAKIVTKEAGIEIMGLRHNEFPIEGIQFHPESFATEGGKKMLENFISQTA